MTAAAGNTPQGAAWLFVAGQHRLPAAGIAMPALDFGVYGGVESIGLLHGAATSPVEIPQVARVVVDIFEPDRVRFFDRDKAAPDAAMMTYATFEDAHSKQWIKELDAQLQVLLVTYTDIFLATRFFEAIDSAPTLVRRLFRNTFLGLAPLTTRLTSSGAVAHRSPLYHYRS